MSTSLLSVSVLLLSVSYCLYRSPPASLKSAWSRILPSRRPQSAGPIADEKTNGDSTNLVPSGSPTELATSTIQTAPGDGAQEPERIDQKSSSFNVQEHGVPNIEAPFRRSDVSETTPSTTPSSPPTSTPDDQPPSKTTPGRGLGQPKETRTGGQQTTTLQSYPSPSASELMPPPPPRPQRAPAPPPASSSPAATARIPPATSSYTNTFRIPSTGPLPNRGPPSASLLATPATSSTLAPPSRSRRPVTLQPGHSPLDWAALTRSSHNLSGVPRFTRVTPSELTRNNGRRGMPAWAVYKGTVYNVTPYLDFHPGGKGELMRGAGNMLGEKLFGEVHPWVNWQNMLGSCVVGVMVPEGDGEGEGEGLEGMD